jgi:DNA repair photolyase
MGRRTEFFTYRPKHILNKAKRAAHWFWTRYSAYPYLGCQHGCAFCYCRERKFSPYEEVNDFSHRIKVKENAADLLRRELYRQPVDLIFTGDYQAAERKFEISRRMLEVCLELGFPVFILERSPLVLRDLDLIQAIHQRARVIVPFSIIYTPEHPEKDGLRALENLAPPPEKRFQAMEKLAAAGIPTGTCFMPALPELCDNSANIEAVVRWTAEHGGQFVLAGGLTLADQQRLYFMKRLTERFPELVKRYEALYPPETYGMAGNGWHAKARLVRKLCERYGIRDRVPRPIIPGDKRAANKRIVEILAEHCYALEISDAPDPQMWDYRKAAWAVEDLEQDIRLIYSQMGSGGLQSIPGLSLELAIYVEKLLLEMSLSPD